MVNTFDRLKIIAPLDCINYNPDCSSFLYRPIADKKTRNIMFDDYNVLGNKNYGIRRSEIKQSKDQVTLDFSGKILLDNYHKLISINNIEECLYRYNKETSIDINVQKFIDNAKVINCDTTQMIYPDYDIELCMDSLLMYDTKDRCEVTRYLKKLNSGIEFNASTKREKRRLVLYDKYSAIKKNFKSDNAFLSKCKDPAKIINDCKGSLRVEQTHSTLSSIRNRFMVTENTLLNVLHSVQPVNRNFFNLVERKGKSKKNNLGFQYDLFGQSNEKKFIEVVKEIGYRGVIVKCDYDLNKIKSFCKTYSSSERSKQMNINKFKPYLKEMLEERFNEEHKSQTHEKITKHIFELIKVA